MISSSQPPGLLAVALTAVLGVSACAGPGTTPTGGSAPTGSSPTADAGEALRRSLDALGTSSYTFRRTGAYMIGDIENGVVHLPAGTLLEQKHAATMRVGDAVYLRYLIHGEAAQRDAYQRLRTKGATPAQVRAVEEIYSLLDGKQWVRVDEKRLEATAAIEEQSGLDYLARLPKPGQTDVPEAGALIKAVTSAQWSGETITGTLDATRVDPDLAILFGDPTHLYGPRAKALDYRATLDDQGRLTELTVSMPDEMASQPPEPTTPEPPVVIEISQYGQAAPPTAPAGAKDLPAVGYEMLSNDVD